MSISSKFNYALESLSGMTVGNINITGNIYQNAIPYVGSQWTTTSSNLSYTSGSVIIPNGVTIGNLNFTGSIYQNGSPYLSTQWTTTSGNISYTGGNVIINGLTSTGSLTTPSASVSNLINTNITTSNIILNDNSAITIDAGPSSRLALVKKSGGGPSIATNNVTDMLFQASNSTTAGNPSANTYTTLMSLSTKGNLSVTGTTNTVALSAGSIYASIISSGNMLVSGNITVGNNLIVAGSLIAVNITSVNLIENNITTASIVGLNSSFSNMTTTNHSSANSILVNNTLVNAILTNLTVSNLVTNNLNLGISSSYSGSFIAANNVSSAANVTGLIFNSSNIRFVTITLTATINTSTPSTLVAVFTIRATYNGTWNIMTSYIGDTTNIVFTIDSSTGQIKYTSPLTANFTDSTFRYRVEQYSTNGTYTSVLGSTIGNYILNTVQITGTDDVVPGNNVGALQILGGVTINKGLFVAGDCIFTSTGSLGINTTSPAYDLDINGVSRISSRLDIGGTQPSYNNNTIGRLFITGAQNSPANGPNIVINTAQDIYPTYNMLTYGHDFSWMMFDMYYDGASFRNSFTTTAYQIVKNSGQLLFNYNNTGFSAGAAATTSTAICIGSGGNIGLGGQVAPAYTLDVSGGSRFTGNITTGAVYSTNVTSTNIVATAFSTASAQITNENVTTSTIATARITSNLIAIGNSNTVGNIYTTGGNVGINTASPASTLHLGSGDIKLDGYGTIDMQTGNYRSYITHQYMSSAYTGIPIQEGISMAFNFRRTNNSSGNTFNTNGSIHEMFITDNYIQFLTLPGPAGTSIPLERMRIANSGNIGINTTSPVGKLHTVLSTSSSGGAPAASWDSTYSVFGQSGVQGAGIGLTYTSSTTGIANNYEGGYLTSLAPGLAWKNMSYWALNHYFHNSGSLSPSLTINNNGNVGIGTTSPSSRLEVRASSYPNITLTTDDNYVNAVDFDSTNKTGGVKWRVMSTQQSAGEGVGKFVVQQVSSGTSPFCITSTGNVGINTLSPTYNLEVAGTIRASVNLLANTLNVQNDRIQFNSSTFYVLNGSSIGVNLASGATAWAAQSDERIKNIIKPISNALENVDQLNPVIYSWKSDDTNEPHPGLIAQDVIKVQPEAVFYDENSIMNVRYTELIPLAFAAIKELKEENANLKTQIYEMNSRLLALENKII